MRYWNFLSNYDIFVLLNFNFNYLNFLLINLYRHQYYIIKEIDPTEEKEGKIYFTCGLCGKNKTKEIPKLDDNNYHN